MTINEAWTKYLTTLGEHLPWEPPPAALKPAFEAGWAAHKEALKQSDLFPGTLSGDLCPVSSMAERLPCSEETAVRSGAGAPAVTAEDIYAAWPVKKARGAAITAIKKAMKKADADKLLDAVKELAECYAKWPVNERQYLPMCSTFMNQERWLDDRQTWRKGHQSTATRKDAF